MKDEEALFLYGDFNFRLDLQSVVKVLSFMMFVCISIGISVFACILPVVCLCLHCHCIIDCV